MYLVSRKYKVEKGYAEVLTQRYTQASIIEKQAGFVRLDFFVNTLKSDYDYCVVHVYWCDKEAFLAWERSPEHLAGHKQKKERPKEILELEFMTYELAAQKMPNLQ